MSQRRRGGGALTTGLHMRFSELQLGFQKLQLLRGEVLLQKGAAALVRSPCVGALLQPRKNLPCQLCLLFVTELHQRARTGMSGDPSVEESVAADGTDEAPPFELDARHQRRAGWHGCTCCSSSSSSSSGSWHEPQSSPSTRAASAALCPQQRAAAAAVATSPADDAAFSAAAGAAPRLHCEESSLPKQGDEQLEVKRCATAAEKQKGQHLEVKGSTPADETRTQTLKTRRFPAQK